MNVQQQRAKWAAFIADPTDLVRGTCNGYTNRGCRCQPCRDAWSERHRAYMATHDEQRAQHRMREAARRGVLSDGSVQGIGLVGFVAACRCFGAYRTGRKLLAELGVPHVVQGLRSYYDPADIVEAVRRKHEHDLANLAERLEANRKVGGQS